MRLKKSSSGTVGPFVGEGGEEEGGAAHRWSLSLDPWNIGEINNTVTSAINEELTEWKNKLQPIKNY